MLNLRPKRAAFAVLFAVSLLAACAAKPSADGADTRLRYDLACDSMQVNGKEPLLCVRIDTETGASWLIETTKLSFAPDLAVNSASVGPTRSAQIGRYALECNGTTSASDGAFRCLRLDRVTGDVGVVPLKALPIYPERTPAEAGALQPAAVAVAPSANEAQRPENQQP